MESGISYKGCLFVFDEDNEHVIVFQGEENKVSLNVPGSFVSKFLVWKGDLYALTLNGHLYKLLNMVSGSYDNWSLLVSVPSSGEGRDMVIYDDRIHIISESKIYSWDDSDITEENDFQVDLGYSVDVYSAVYCEELIILYGANATEMVLLKYNGSSTSLVWSDDTHGLTIDYSFYNVYGKSLIQYYNGIIYWTYHYDASYIVLKTWNVTSNKISSIDRITDESIAGIVTVMKIFDGILFMSVYVSGTGSYIYTHPIDEYKIDCDLPTADINNEGKIETVSSDLVLESKFGKGFTSYYNKNMLLGLIQGRYNTLFKYGSRIEYYTDLNSVKVLQNKSLKAMLDDICNLLNSYVIARPENVVEIGIKDVVGKSNEFLLLSDDKSYGDVEIIQVKSFTDGENDFHRFVISWNNDIIGSGEEVVGSNRLISGINEYSISSDLVNNPILAKNIAVNLFGETFNSESIEMDLSWAHMLRVNYNVSIKAISSYLRINEDKEYKLVSIKQDWVHKITEVVLVERNLVSSRLEI